MRFVDDNNNNARFKESFNVIKEKDSPIRNLGNADKPTTFSYYPETVVNSDELFQLKVNTKSVGTFLFAFYYKRLDREKLIDRVFTLKKLNVTDKETALRKVDRLKDIVQEFNPVFVVYSNPDIYALTIDEAKEIFNGINFFYVEKEDSVEETVLSEETPIEKSSEVTEETPKDEVNETPEKETVEATIEEKKQSEQSTWNKIKNIFKESGRIIKQDKFNFIFALVASFLIGFTLGVGIYNAYLGKYICIFFFVSTLVGMALNSFVYRDTLVDYKFKSLHIILDIITSLIGIGIAIGGYFLFIYITKEKANPSPSMLFILAIQFACLCASIGFAFILKKFNKKKK